MRWTYVLLPRCKIHNASLPAIQKWDLQKQQKHVPPSWSGSRDCDDVQSNVQGVTGHYLISIAFSRSGKTACRAWSLRACTNNKCSCASTRSPIIFILALSTAKPTVSSPDGLTQPA